MSVTNIPPFNFTAAQLRALDFLPVDGGWTLLSGNIGRAINSLYLSHARLIETQWGDFGKRGGRALRVRLTQGIEVKEHLSSGRIYRH